MSEEIAFLIDELEETNKKELERLIKLMDHPLAEQNTYILWKFTRALLKASREKKWLEEHKVEEKPEENNDEIKITFSEPVKTTHDELYTVNKDGEKDLSLKISKEMTSGIFIPEMPTPPAPGIFGKQEEIRIVNQRRYAIVFDRETNKGLVYVEIKGKDYFAIEPTLTQKDELILKKISKKFGKKISKLAFDKEKLASLLGKLCKKEAIQYNDVYYVNMRYYLMRDNMFSGKIEPLMHDDKISKIICDGKKVKIEYTGIPLDTNVEYSDADEVKSIINKWLSDAKMKPGKDNAFSFNLNGFRTEGKTGENPSFTLTKL
ncbi:MAG TPA: hypothetical protein VJC07_05530 [Candidatus Nanoarchaeia archaeon]|nr:hypothetical protein [Candidatus Nanoarchaeia archaeon]